MYDETTNSEILSRLKELEISIKNRRDQWRDIVLPLVSILVAFSGIAVGAYIQYVTLKENKNLKTFEVTFEIKQKGYSNFVKAEEKLYYVAREFKVDQEFISASDDVWFNFFFLHPFFSQDKLKEAQNLISKFETDCHAFSSGSRQVELPKLVREKEELFQFFLKELFQNKE
jgi:hypothetical protein